MKRICDLCGWPIRGQPWGLTGSGSIYCRRCAKYIQGFGYPDLRAYPKTDENLGRRLPKEIRKGLEALAKKKEKEGR